MTTSPPRPPRRPLGGVYGRLAAIAFAVAVVTGAARSEEAGGAPPPEPADYRMEEYRAPTPATLQGARVVDTAAAEPLWRNKSAIFIDTMPRAEKPAGLPPGTIWRDKPRDHVPGSAWLGNVGYGALSPDMERYFRSALDALAGGERSKPLLFYCRSDCWMSWNAAKRAMSWGYTDVIWYPEGTDGWEQARLPSEPARPYVLPASGASQ